MTHWHVWHVSGRAPNREAKEQGEVYTSDRTATRYANKAGGHIRKCEENCE